MYEQALLEGKEPNIKGGGPSHPSHMVKRSQRRADSKRLQETAIAALKLMGEDVSGYAPYVVPEGEDDGDGVKDGDGRADEAGDSKSGNAQDLSTVGGGEHTYVSVAEGFDALADEYRAYMTTPFPALPPMQDPSGVYTSPSTSMRPGTPMEE